MQLFPCAGTLTTRLTVAALVAMSTVVMLTSFGTIHSSLLAPLSVQIFDEQTLLDAQLECPAYTDLPAAQFPFHVLWPSSLVGYAKEDHFWIFDLLSAVHRPLFVHVYDSANITSKCLEGLNGDFLFFGFTDQLRALVTAANETGRRGIGVFHIGDENAWHGTEFYESPTVAFVLRPYYFERIQNMSATLNKPIIWVPNGYNHLIGPRQLSQQIPLRMRNVLCYFGGSMRGKERPEVVDLLQGRLAHYQCKLDITPTFNQGLASLAYTNALQNSIFVLCPAGNSVETIRLYEAMENGAIPVMLNHSALVTILRDVPVVFLNSWQDLDSVLASYVANPAALEARQAAVLKGWFALKSALRRQIALVIHQVTSTKASNP